MNIILKSFFDNFSSYASYLSYKFNWTTARALQFYYSWSYSFYFDMGISLYFA